MAKQDKIFLSGQVGPVIFYEYRGIPCARSQATKVRQTRATKNSAKQFGKAVHIAKMLRAGLGSLLPDAKDIDMRYRFNNALLQWLRNDMPANGSADTDLPFIDSFEFNKESELSGRLKLPLSIDWTKPGTILLTIPRLDPAQVITAPAYTQTVHWQITVTGFSMSKDEVTESYSVKMDMDYNKGFIATKQLSLPFVLKPGDITIVALALKFSAEKKGTVQVITDKRWLPAGIVGACYGKPV
jgi:hypothetical protein